MYNQFEYVRLSNYCLMHETFRRTCVELPSFNRNAKCNSREQTGERESLMKNSIWTEITAQRIRQTDRATFYRTNETGDKVGCIGRRGENPRVSIHPRAPFFPSPCPLHLRRTGRRVSGPSWYQRTPILGQHLSSQFPSRLASSTWYFHLCPGVPTNRPLSLSLLGNLKVCVCVYLRNCVHLPLGEFSLVSPVFLFHYDSSVFTSQSCWDTFWRLVHDIPARIRFTFFLSRSSIAV